MSETLSLVVYTCNTMSWRLLENKTIDLSTAVDPARALDTTQKCSESYTHHPIYTVHSITEADSNSPLVSTCAITTPKIRCCCRAFKYVDPANLEIIEVTQNRQGWQKAKRVNLKPTFI